MQKKGSQAVIDGLEFATARITAMGNRPEMWAATRGEFILQIILLMEIAGFTGETWVPLEAFSNDLSDSPDFNKVWGKACNNPGYKLSGKLSASWAKAVAEFTLVKLAECV